MGKKVRFICEVCGKDIFDYPSRSRKTCSRKCFKIYYNSKRIKIKCRFCNKEIFVLECLNRKYCSQGCKNLHQSELNRGSNNPFWKEVKKDFSYKDNILWDEWRTKVFERDNFTCQCCGERGSQLEPHHLKSKACFPELVYDVDNGVTLCKKHHRLLHKIVPSNSILIVKEFPLSILNGSK